MATVLETTELGQAHAILSEQYASMQVHSPGQHHGLRVEQEELGPVRLDHMGFGMSVDLASDPLQAVCIGRIREGYLECAFEGEKLRWQRGDVFLPVQPQDPFDASIHNMAVDYAIIDPGLFDRLATPAPGEHAPVRLLGAQPVSPSAAAHWSRIYTQVHQTMTQPGLQVTPLVATQAAQLLAATALSVFPNNAALEPTAADGRDAHPDAVRRAVAFIEANPDLELTLTDIARAASVSTRALQLAFRRHLETTPMRYLRRVRLDRAHVDLQAAAPGDGTTVTGVASRWGYARPSRFAADYRAAYGEHPHRTLRSG